MSAVVILIVEDEPIQRMVMVDLVEDAGFEPLEAPNADTAVAILESRSDVRVLLTDIDMPGSMSGTKLASTVRTRWPPVEIILVSAGRPPAPDVLPERSVFIPKPLRPELVVAALRKFVAET